MAAANGLATTLGFCVEKANSKARAGIRSNRLGFGLERRNGVVRCEIGSEVEEMVAARASSVSALEQFKAAGTDRYMKERSSLAVIGLSVHTAPVEMREKLAVPEAQWPRAIGELCNLNHIEEAAVLSTCNRMEIYVVALSWNRGIRELME